MRLIFMGNPEFAVPTLQALVGSGFDVVGVVTNPDQPVGRGRNLRSSAVALAARSANLKLIQPDSLNDANFHSELRNLLPDLFVVVAFRILPQTLLEIPKIGSVNLHGSLLPRYRGAAPIQWALINGDKLTGLTTFLIKPKVDTGDIVDFVELPIQPEDDYGSLSQRMQPAGAKLIVNTIQNLIDGRAIFQTQDNSKATKAPKITKEICRIDWNQPNSAILNLIRGLAPVPGAFTTIAGKRLKLFKSVCLPDSEQSAVPGEIVLVSDTELQVQTSSGIIAVESCQLEGKRRLDVKEFLHGTNIVRGIILGE